MKAREYYFHVVLFIMRYKVVLTFKSEDEILVRGHRNESYGAVLIVLALLDLLRMRYKKLRPESVGVV